MNSQMHFSPNIYFQGNPVGNPDASRHFGGFGFGRPFGGFGFGLPFLGGLAGGLLAGSLLSPYGYGYGGFGFPYGYGYGYPFGY